MSDALGPEGSYYEAKRREEEARKREEEMARRKKDAAKRIHKNRRIFAAETNSGGTARTNPAIPIYTKLHYKKCTLRKKIIFQKAFFSSGKLPEAQTLESYCLYLQKEFHQG